MANILVTGGVGFIGSNLVDCLIEQGHQVTVYDCDVHTKYNRRVMYYNVQVECIHPEYHSDKRYDIIFHLAAKSRIQPSFSNPTETHDSNVTGTIKMLELARVTHSKFIFAGSSSVYHDVFANPYSFTKHIGEQYCEIYNKLYKVPVAIARFFNVYGPRQVENGPYATVIGIFERQRRNNVPLTITGDGEKRRDFIHVDDIVSGLLAMSKDNWDANVFNLGTGINYSINEVAKMFNHPIKYIPARSGEAENTLADIENIKSLGWKPKYSLEQYISSIKC